MTIKKIGNYEWDWEREREKEWTSRVALFIITVHEVYISFIAEKNIMTYVSGWWYIKAWIYFSSTRE